MLISIIILILFSCSRVLAADSLSVVANDTLTVDSLIFYEPIPRHGSAEILKHTYHQRITKDDVLDISYSQLSDILYKSTNYFPQSLGSFGLYNHLSIFGSGSNTINFSYNNRNINDLNFGGLNLEQISPESFESLEIFTGSDAVILGDNAQGAFINIQQKKFNAGIPYSRLVYAQAGLEFISADVIFSQNFRPNWNATLGVRNMNSLGRYDNQKLRAWNVRADIRWNISDLSSITLTENFTNHGTGTNGGVNRENSTLIFDDIFANVNYEDFSERLFRHDLTLSYTSILDKDSVSAINLNAYYSHSEWNQSSGNDFYIDYSDSSNKIIYYNSLFGLSGKYEFDLLDFFFLNAGGKIENVVVDNTPFNDEYSGINYSAYGRGIISIGEIFDLTGGARLSYQYGNSALAFGAAALFKIFGYNAKFDLSISERVPTPSEGLDLDKENHFLALFELSSSFEKSDFSIYTFARYIDNPIIGIMPYYDSNLNERVFQVNNETKSEIYGAGIDFGFNFLDDFSLRSKSILQVSNLNGVNDERYPLIFSNLIIGYSKLIKNKILSTGISVKVISDFKGYTFAPEKRIYVPQNESSTFSNNGIDIFASAKLGDSIVKLEFINALSQGYYYVPLYPELTANLKLSVTWAFLN